MQLGVELLESRELLSRTPLEFPALSAFADVAPEPPAVTGGDSQPSRHEANDVGGQFASPLKDFSYESGDAGREIGVLGAGSFTRDLGYRESPVERFGAFFRQDTAAAGTVRLGFGGLLRAVGLDLREALVERSFLVGPAPPVGGALDGRLFRVFVLSPGEPPDFEGKGTPPPFVRAYAASAGLALHPETGPVFPHADDVSLGPIGRSLLVGVQPPAVVFSGLAALYSTPRSGAEARSFELRPSAAPLVGNVVGGADNRVPVGRGDPASLIPPPVCNTEPGPLPRETVANLETIPPPLAGTTDPAERSYLPETAGLVTSALSTGLATMERAVRNLTEPEADVYRSGTALLYWLGVSAWLLGGAVAYESMRRRRAGRGDPELYLEGLS